MKVVKIELNEKEINIISESLVNKGFEHRDWIERIVEGNAREEEINRLRDLKDVHDKIQKALK